MHACTLFGQQVTRKLCFLLPAFVMLNGTFSLKPLDIEIMKRLGTRVNLISVIAKADTLTFSPSNDVYVASLFSF